jgi:CheY-like chemotaxis protein
MMPRDQRWLERKEPAGRGRTVLLLGGDQGMAELIEQGLEDYLVVPVNDVSAVPDLLEETFARGIIINLIHKRQGWKQLKALRQISVQVPIILCPLVGEREFGEALGVFDYLVKPVSAQDITDLLDRLAEQHLAVEHILVVDDDPRMTNLLPRMFHGLGKSFEIARAYNGQMGLEKMRQQCPDLVLLDLSMPEMDGFAMLEQLKADKELCDVPVVLISAHTRTPEEERQLSGKMMFISSQTGFTNEDVLEYVQGILDHANLPDVLPRSGQLIKHHH